MSTAEVSADVKIVPENRTHATTEMGTTKAVGGGGGGGNDTSTTTTLPGTDATSESGKHANDVTQQTEMAKHDASDVPEPHRPAGSVDRPELAEDFLRNFLMKKGLLKTFEAFQAEWYDKMQSGLLEYDETVPDCYVANIRLEEEVQRLRLDLEQRSAEASKAVSTAETVAKERDFHRISHRRVKDEKRELQAALARFEAEAVELREKLATTEARLEKALRQKATAAIGLERLRRESAESTEATHAKGSDRHASSLDAGAVLGSSSSGILPEPELPGQDGAANGGVIGAHMPATPAVASTRRGVDAVSVGSRAFAAAALDSRMPTLSRTFRAHDEGVSAVAIDPTGATIATASDDGTVRTWQPDSELLLEGEGHGAWVSSCVFHPADPNVAATGSGDATVKLWDLAGARCTATLSGHAYAVLGIDFHCSGDFVASASLDNTLKLWDVGTQRCRRTLRGHTDAANSVEFQSASNMAVSAGADRSCLLWDTRLGRATAGLRGHGTAVFHAVFSPDGGTVASVDAAGVVKLWEMRTGRAVASAQIAGGAPANTCRFDPTGSVLVVGSEDSTIRLFSVEDIAGGPLCELRAHTDAVQGLAFNPSTGALVSGSADGTVRTWSFD